MGTKNADYPSYRWVILSINVLVCALAYAGLTTWSTASTELVNTFQVSDTVASLGCSLFMVGYAVGSFVEAQIAAKYSYRSAGLLGLLLMVVGIFFIPLAPNFGVVLALRFIQGWGILWLVGTNSTIAWFPMEQRGIASSMIGASLLLGIGSGSLVATGLMNIAGTWQGAFRIFALILLIASILWGILMREPPKGLYKEENVVTSLEESPKINPYKTAAAWLCTICLFMNAWQNIGFSSFASNYMRSLTYTDVQAGTIVLVYGLIGVVSTIVGGAISDTLVRKGMTPVRARALTTAFPAFLITGIASLIFPTLAPISYSMALLTVILVGWGVPITNGTLGALPMDLLGDEEAAGKMFGMTIFFGIGLGGLLAPVGCAWLIENFGYSVAMYSTAIACFIGFLVALLLPRFQLKNSSD